MEKYYGNYLGIVINDQDPEGRNRVQVWIPHLTNTLFSDWNNNDDNKQIEDLYNDVPITLINRLKNNLPWAECAAPLIGGGSAVMNNVASNTGDSISPPVAESNQLDFTTDDPAVTSESGQFLGGAPENNNDELLDALPGGQVAEDGTVGGFEESIDFTATPVTQPLKSDGENALTTLPDVKTENSTVGGKITQDHNGKTRNRDLSDNLQNSIFNGLKGSGLDWVSTSGGQPTVQEGGPRIGSTRHDNGNATDGYFVESSTGRPLNPASNAEDRKKIETVLPDLVSNGIKGVGWGVDYMGEKTFHLDIIGDKNGGVLTWGANGKSVNAAPWVTSSVTSVSNSTQIAQTSETDSTLVTKDHTAEAAPAYGTQGHGNSKGTFSNTTVSAKVWVFFYGGDIQKPVYFAHSMSASEYLTS